MDVSTVNKRELLHVYRYETEAVGTKCSRVGWNLLRQLLVVYRGETVAVEQSDPRRLGDTTNKCELLLVYRFGTEGVIL